MSIFKSDCLEMFTPFVHFIGLLRYLEITFNNELVMAHTSSSIQLTKIFQIAQDERNSQIAQIIQNA